MVALEEAVVVALLVKSVEKEILLRRFLHKVPMVVPEHLDPRPLLIRAAVAAVAVAKLVKMELMPLQVPVEKAEMELRVQS